MALPDPKPGLVVRYDYLWTHEAAAGRDQGKTRPTCLIAATDPAVLPRYVVLLPITHTPPGADSAGIEIPVRVRQALGLDDTLSWMIVSEHNIDEWPEMPGCLRCPVSRTSSATVSSHRDCSRRSSARFLELARANESRTVRR